jgi:hypothetical protein
VPMSGRTGESEPGSRRASLDNSEVVRRSPYIRWNREALERPGRGTTESPSMSLLTTSIESTHLTRWNFGLVALTLLGVFAIALALILPNSITP